MYITGEIGINHNGDLEIVWHKDSTGVLTARILAERGERGDAVWGLAATSMMRLKKQVTLAFSVEFISANRAWMRKRWANKSAPMF